MRDKSGFGAETILTAGGAATSLAAAYANYLFANSIGIDVSSFMYWFVLPVGAGIVGAVAASGYYITSLWTQRPATPLLAVNMVLVGLSTYALIQYLTYHALKFADGMPIADQVPFWLYYRFKIEHTSLQLVRGGASTGELGPMGYLYEGARIVGFLLGGWVVYLYLKDKPYCESCKRYFGPRQILLGDTPAPAEVDSFAQTLWFDVSGLADQYRAVIGERGSKAFKVTITACVTCDRKQVRFIAVPKENEEVFAIYNFQGNSPFRDKIETPATPVTAPEEPLNTTTQPHHAASLLTFGCWACKSPIEIRPDERGQTVQCPKCGKKQASPQP